VFRTFGGGVVPASDLIRSRIRRTPSGSRPLTGSSNGRTWGSLSTSSTRPCGIALAAEARLAGVRPVQAHDHAYRGGLARAAAYHVPSDQWKQVITLLGRGPRIASRGLRGPLPAFPYERVEVRLKCPAAVEPTLDYEREALAGVFQVSLGRNSKQCLKIQLIL